MDQNPDYVIISSDSDFESDITTDTGGTGRCPSLDDKERMVSTCNYFTNLHHFLYGLDKYFHLYVQFVFVIKLLDLNIRLVCSFGE